METLQSNTMTLLFRIFMSSREYQIQIVTRIHLEREASYHAYSMEKVLLKLRSYPHNATIHTRGLVNMFHIAIAVSFADGR